MKASHAKVDATSMVFEELRNLQRRLAARIATVRIRMALEQLHRFRGLPEYFSKYHGRAPLAWYAQIHTELFAPSTR